MKTIEQMLRELARPDVAEFAIASGRLPCIKVGGAYKPVDDAAPSTDAILQMLVAVGGSRYVDSLGAKPTQWTTRLDGVGSLTVAAIMRDDKVQARFVVSRREDASAPPPPPAAAPRTPSQASGRMIVPTPGIAMPVPGRTPTSDAPAANARGGTAMPRVQPPLEFEVSPQAAVAAAPAAPPVALHAGIREIEFDAEEEDRPTRPAGMKIELELGEGRLDAEQPMGTARDIEFDASGQKASVAPATARGFGESMVLEELLGASRAAGASDLHVIAERPLLMRIAGDLQPRGEPIDARTVESMIFAAVPPRCKATLTEEGSCDFAMTHPEHGRFRVNVTRQRTGIKACFRLIAPTIPTLASLGLPEDIAKVTHHHQGLIVVTGPTGHGKTSTMAAIVDIINRETTHHVITVEDPVEYVHPRKKAMMSQREVGTHTLSFANALKASLREDPDVIVVGELRDTETVRMALSASETGHLVIGTMNTPSAAKTIDRLIDLFPPADQSQVRLTLAGGLRLIVSQRLLPSVDGSRMHAAAELLPGGIALWSLIRDNKTFQIPSLQQRGKGFGIIRIDDSLAELVRAGAVSREAALVIAENPDELDAVLAGKRQPIAAPEAPKPNAATNLFQKAGSLFGGKKG